MPTPKRERKFTYVDEPLEIRCEGDDGHWYVWGAYALEDRDVAIAHVNRLDQHRNVKLVELPTDWRSILDRKFDALERYIRWL